MRFVQAYISKDIIKQDYYVVMKVNVAPIGEIEIKTLPPDLIRQIEVYALEQAIIQLRVAAANEGVVS
jgi:hypothetical protein